MAMFDNLHFRKSPYEIALKHYIKQVETAVIALMESDGIYKLPLLERQGAWGKRWDLVTAKYPKPKIEDFEFEGNQRDQLLFHACNSKE